MRVPLALVLLILLLGCTGTGGRSMSSSSSENCSVARDAALAASLSSARILFGHQSVGGNILRGLEEITAPVGGIPLREWDPSAADLPRGILHFRVGTNGDPASKIRSFEKMFASAPAAELDAAGFKFCFDDFDGRTDVRELFGAYEQAVTRIHEGFPRLRIYHLTVPPTTRDSKARRVAKWLLRRPSSFRLNRDREAFNRLLRAHFGDDGLLFDLAALEAEVSPAAAMGMKKGGVLYLSSRFTDDGAHLNETGRRIIACRWMSFLAGLVSPPSSEEESR